MDNSIFIVDLCANTVSKSKIQARKDIAGGGIYFNNSKIQSDKAYVVMTTLGAVCVDFRKDGTINLILPNVPKELTNDYLYATAKWYEDQKNDTKI